RRRTQHARPRGRRRGGLRLRRHRPPGVGVRAPPRDLLMEALLLAGGKAERLGDAARGNPKPLVPIHGYPLADYVVHRLAQAGVTRVIVACRAGDEALFEERLSGQGPEIAAVGEPE